MGILINIICINYTHGYIIKFYNVIENNEFNIYFNKK